MLAASVAENVSEWGYTADDVQRARDVQELEARTGFSSRGTLKHLLHNRLRNTRLLPQDVEKKYKIFGPNVARLKGVTTARNKSAAPLELTKVGTEVELRALQPTEQLMCVDVFFVEGEIFLISFTDPLGFLIVSRIRNKQKGEVMNALRSHVAAYSRADKQFVMRQLSVDGEGALHAMRADIERELQVILSQSKGTHIGLVERQIRRLKEVSRSVLASLPYSLPKFLLRYVVFFAVTCLNIRPSRVRNTNLSPWEIFYGRRVDARRDLRVAFGRWVQTHPVTTSNTMEERTQGGLALYPINNSHGSWKFFVGNSRTGQHRIITRHHFTEVPLDDTHIAELNALAAVDPIPRTGVMRFRRLRNGQEQEIDEGHLTDDDDELTEIKVKEPPGLVPATRGVHDAAAEQADQTVDGVPGTSSHAAETQPSAGEKSGAFSHGPVSRQFNVLPRDIDGEADERLAWRAEQSAGALGVAPPVTRLQARVGEDGRPAGADNTGPPQPHTAIVGFSTFTPSTTGHGTSLLGLGEGRLPIFDGLLKRGSTSRGERAGATSVWHISVSDALAKHGPQAKASIELEFRQLAEKGTFEPLSGDKLTPERRRRAIYSSMFLKEKWDSDGNWEKLKSRLVAGGNTQDKSLFKKSEVSSPTVATSSLLAIIAIAANEKRHLATVDIGGAFVRSDMRGPEEVIVTINSKLAEYLLQVRPDWRVHRQSNGTLFLLCHKALYGCVQSARLWYENISGFLFALEFVVNTHDPCVFNKVVDGGQITVCMHVDDLLISCADDNEIDRLIEQLTVKYTEVTAHRSENGRISYLGMTLDVSVIGEVRITMSRFIEETLEFAQQRFSLDRPYAAPADTQLFSIDETSEPLEDEASAHFHSCTARLLYLGKRVRPDILLAVGFLSTRVLAPTREDSGKLERLLRYVKNTSSLGIRFGGGEGPLAFFSYIDASFAVHPDFRSQTGAVITVGGGPVHAASSKQKLNTKSSCEAELVGLSDESSVVIGIDNFLKEQGLQLGAARIGQDNQATVKLIENGRSNSPRTRHINIRFFYLHDRVASGQVALEYVRTDDMVADILTKPLVGEKFRQLRKKLLNW